MNALSGALQSSASSWADQDEIARQAGVTSRQVSLARSGKPVNAGAFLALCAVSGVDPVTGTSRPPQALSPNVAWWLLSSALYIRRNLKKLDQRAAAEAIGVSPASVCRVELGHPVSIGVMLKICAFIGVHPFGYTAPLVCPPEIVSQTVSRGTSTETRCSHSDIDSDAAAQDVSA
jgi:transcriptional regulator with XRE-family HTH domain